MTRKECGRSKERKGKDIKAGGGESRAQHSEDAGEHLLTAPGRERPPDWGKPSLSACRTQIQSGWHLGSNKGLLCAQKQCVLVGVLAAGREQTRKWASKARWKWGDPPLPTEVIRERRARSQFVESFSSRHKTSGLSPSIIETGCSGIRLLTLVLGKWRQEDQKFEISRSYAESWVEAGLGHVWPYLLKPK